MQPLSGSTQTTGGTIITVPAATSWVGTVAVSVENTGTGTGEISLDGGGDGAAPDSGTVILRVHCQADSDSLSVPLTVIAGSVPATLVFTSSESTVGTGMASGILMQPGSAQVIIGGPGAR
jgi:hypothetical protein